MPKVKILVGDFGRKDANLSTLFGICQLQVPKEGFTLKIEAIDLKKELERVEIQTEDSVKKLAGTAGWGLAGGVLFGPLGLLAGIVFGGRKKDVLFTAYLKDGRKFLAVTDSKAFKSIQAAAF